MKPIKYNSRKQHIYCLVIHCDVYEFQHGKKNMTLKYRPPFLTLL